MSERYCRCQDRAADGRSVSRFCEAYELQDAVNLRAIARSLVRATDEAAEDGKSTKEIYTDPAVILIVDKIKSLCYIDEQSTFAAAWSRCGTAYENERKKSWAT